MKAKQKIEIACRGCGRGPHEIGEYIEIAKEEDITPHEYVIKEEGTYNSDTGKFYCTACYVRAGMPLGKA